VLSSPAFGKADLTNCERELIQFAGSVQPHGILMVLREPGFEIIQVSANSQGLLGVDADSLLGKPVSLVGDSLSAVIHQTAASPNIAEPAPLVCQLLVRDRLVAFEGTIHRVAGNALIVEIEPIANNPEDAETETVSMPSPQLLDHMNLSIQRFGDASTIGTLCDGGL
jgi:chemotaxis family two-component system sensor kinase Cph1